MRINDTILILTSAYTIRDLSTYMYTYTAFFFFRSRPDVLPVSLPQTCQAIPTSRNRIGRRKKCIFFILQKATAASTAAAAQQRAARHHNVSAARDHFAGCQYANYSLYLLAATAPGSTPATPRIIYVIAILCYKPNGDLSDAAIIFFLYWIYNINTYSSNSRMLRLPLRSKRSHRHLKNS